MGIIQRLLKIKCDYQLHDDTLLASFQIRVLYGCMMKHLYSTTENLGIVWVHDGTLL